MSLAIYEKKKQDAIDEFVVLILMLVVMVPLTLLQGFVLVKLWGWFIVTIFNLPALTLVPAIGLILTIKYLTAHSHYSYDDRDEYKKLLDYVGTGVTYPLLVWLTGYIVHCYM